MKWRLFVLSLILFPVSICRAQNLCEIDDKPFYPGETIQYQLYYNWGPVWISAGTCDFKVRSATWGDKSVYKLSVEGKTQRSFDSFFKVRDTIVSYVSKRTLVPYKAYKYTHEDNWLGTDEFTFHPDENGWTITTRLKRKKQWKAPVVSRTNRCGFDLVTSIYRLRCLSDDRLYVKGRKLNIPVRLDDNEYDVFLTYMGKERIKLYGGGFYNAHAFHISLIEGNVF